jgi:hypothetical protein
MFNDNDFDLVQDEKIYKYNTHIHPRTEPFTLWPFSLYLNRAIFVLRSVDRACCRSMSYVHETCCNLILFCFKLLFCQPLLTTCFHEENVNRIPVYFKSPLTHKFLYLKKYESILFSPKFLFQVIIVTDDKYIYKIWTLKFKLNNEWVTTDKNVVFRKRKISLL